MQNSANKPTAKYAILAKERPTLPPIVLEVAEKEKRREKLSMIVVR